jgi:hypothetical protein
VSAAPRVHGRPAIGSSITGTVLITGLAFWLSFTALSDLARRSGVDPAQAWAWPLIVDGLILVATVAVIALDGHASAWYPWALLMAGTAVSVTANALHATVAADADVPGVLAGCVAAVPPLVELASTHLTVVLLRSNRTPGPALVEEAGERQVPGLVPAAEVLPVPRQLVAARLRDEGWSNKRIARHLGVAPSTIGRWLPRPALAAAGAPGMQESAEELSE